MSRLGQDVLLVEITEQSSQPLISCTVHDLAILGIALGLCVLGGVAYLVVFARDAYLGWKLREACGGNRKAAAGVVFGLQAALDLRTDQRMRAGMRNVEALRLVKR